MSQAPIQPQPDAPAGGPSGGEVRTFTQEELNALFAERAKRAADGAVTDLFQKAGVQSAEELLTKLGKAKEIEDAKLSDLERAKSREEELTAKLAQLQAERDEIVAKATQRAIRSEVMSLARDQFLPEAIEDVWLVIDRSAIKEDAEGNLTGVKEAVAAVAKAKPHWLKSDTAQLKGTPRKELGKAPGAPLQKQDVRPTISF